MKLVVLLFTFAWAGAAAAQQAAPAPDAPVVHRKFGGLYYKPSPDAQNADQAAMKTMMDGMDAPWTGDPDHDFVVHMIPHHQGAIDMCKTELEYGADANIKQLCGRIIAGQQAEIRMMQAWLATHPAKTLNDIPSRIQWK